MKEIRDAERGREGKLLHVLAIRGAQDQHTPPLEAAERFCELRNPDLSHAVVGLPAVAHQAELAVRRVTEKEVRVDGDAMTADADALAVDVRVRLRVRGAERLVDVDVAACRV